MKTVRHNTKFYTNIIDTSMPKFIPTPDSDSESDNDSAELEPVIAIRAKPSKKTPEPAISKKKSRQMQDQDCVFNVTTVQTSLLATILGKLKTVVGDCVLLFATQADPKAGIYEGLNICTDTNDSSSMVSLYIGIAGFTHFYCSKPQVEIAIDVQILSNALEFGENDKDNTWQIYVKKQDPAHLYVDTMDAKYRTGICVDLVDNGAADSKDTKRTVFLRHENKKYGKMFNIECNDFLKICKFSKTSNYSKVIISYRGKKIKFEAVGMSSRIVKEFENLDTSADTDDAKVFCLEFEIKSLTFVDKCKKFSDTMFIYLHKKNPLMILMPIIVDGKQIGQIYFYQVDIQKIVD